MICGCCGRERENSISGICKSCRRMKKYYRRKYNTEYIYMTRIEREEYQVRIIIVLK
jgi:hypothetical protein